MNICSFDHTPAHLPLAAPLRLVGGCNRSLTRIPLTPPEAGRCEAPAVQAETEQRYFVINGQSFAAEPDADIPDIVKECASRIKSKFFSVDAIDRRDGYQRIVEIGDGQVSGLVGWSVDRFTSLWLESSP